MTLSTSFSRLRKVIHHWCASIQCQARLGLDRCRREWRLCHGGIVDKKALKAYVRKPDYAGVLALRGKGLIDLDYDPRGAYGLTEAALERRGLKTFPEARTEHARQTKSSTKPVRKAEKPVAVAKRATGKPGL